MKILKTLGLAALVGFLVNGCMKRTQQEIELYESETALEQYVQEKLPKIMQELENRLHISFEEIPKIEVTSDENGCGKISKASCYYSITNTIELFMGHINTTHFLRDERAYQEIILNLRHELGHAYTDQREDALNSFPYNILRTLVIYSEYQIYSNYLTLSQSKDKEAGQKFNQDNQKELAAFFIYKVLNEGIAQYFEFSDVSIFSEPDLTYCFQKSIEVTEEDEKKNYYTFYQCGRKLLIPLFYQFGVQPVVDYIVQHPPEVTGKLREDILKYQKQIREELGKEKTEEEKPTLEDLSRETP